MKVNIVTRNIPSRRKSRQIKRYALKKMPRLERYIDPDRDPSEARLVLSAEKLRNNAEIIISSGPMKAAASVETDDMRAAIDKLFDTIIKQLRRRTDKQMTLRRRSPSKPSPLPAPARAERSPIVDRKELGAKPMSLAEALLQLDASRTGFFAFRNSETLEMNVVYRKPDSKKVGLITP